MNKGAINALLASIFATAIVTTVVLPNRPVSTSLNAFFSALSNSIRSALGTNSGQGALGGLGDTISKMIRGA